MAPSPAVPDIAHDHHDHLPPTRMDADTSRSTELKGRSRLGQYAGLVDGHRSAGESVVVEVLAVDQVVAVDVLHGCQVGGHRHQIGQGGVCCGRKVGQVLDHRPGVGPGVDGGGAPASTWGWR